MYRLTSKEYPIDSLDEAVRLALLAYSYHIFLQWRDVKLPFSRLQNALRVWIQRLHQGGQMSPGFLLWIMMVAAVSIFDTHEEAWLRKALQVQAFRCEVKTWKQAEDTLKSFLWLPILDDKPGRSVWDTLD